MAHSTFCWLEWGSSTGHILSAVRSRFLLSLTCLDVSFATATANSSRSFRARGAIQTRLESRDRVFEKTQKSCRAFKSSLRYDYVEGWPAVLTREYDQVSLSRSWKRFNLPRHNSEQLYEKSHSSQEGLNGPPACAKLNEGPPNPPQACTPLHKVKHDEYRLSNLLILWLLLSLIFWALPFFHHLRGPLVSFVWRRLMGNCCAGLGAPQSPDVKADLVPCRRCGPTLLAQLWREGGAPGQSHIRLVRVRASGKTGQIFTVRTSFMR